MVPQARLINLRHGDAASPARGSLEHPPPDKRLSGPGRASTPCPADSSSGIWQHLDVPASALLLLCLSSPFWAQE